MTFDIETTDEDQGIRITVRGEVDMTTGDRLEREVRAAQDRLPATLILDLTGVEFLDSTGLQVVLDADIRAQEAGARLVVVPGDGEAARVFALTEVADRLTVGIIE